MNQVTNTLAPHFGNTLVQSEAASNFISLAGTDAGRRAFLGDSEKLDSGAAPDITMAHIKLREGVETIARLLTDETRTEVAKHEAAQTVAGRTIEQLEKSKAAIHERAEYLLSSAQDDAQAGFRLNPERRFVQEQILAHIRTLAGKPEGVTELRQILNEDGEAAAVFANTKPYLLGMSKESHNGLYFKMVEKHLPQVHTKMEAGAKLLELPAKYDKAINSIRSSFYNPLMAKKAASRVQL
jgi:hypothetical protein